MVYIKTVSFQPIMKIIFYFFMSLNAKSVEYLFSCIKKKNSEIINSSYFNYLFLCMLGNFS